MPTLPRTPWLGLVALLAFVSSGCSASPSVDAAMPPTEGVFDYQLGATYDQLASDAGPIGIDVVVRDATAESLEGAYNICYVNGFQTQPDDPAWVGTQDLILHEDGEPVRDPDWPDEFVLDPSTPDQRAGILAVIAPIVESCAAAGFDAVEFDNLDTFARFPAIDQDSAMALATAYVQLAHENGLAAAQKNAAEIAQFAHDELGFDFAIVEECAVFDECAAYAEVYGAHVLWVEYPDSLASAGLSFADVCASPERAGLTILRDRGLVGPDAEGYVYASC